MSNADKRRPNLKYVHPKTEDIQKRERSVCTPDWNLNLQTEQREYGIVLQI